MRLTFALALGAGLAAIGIGPTMAQSPYEVGKEIGEDLRKLGVDKPIQDAIDKHFDKKDKEMMEKLDKADKEREARDRERRDAATTRDSIRTIEREMSGARGTR
jgi:hypothetical protein